MLVGYPTKEDIQRSFMVFCNLSILLIFMVFKVHACCENKPLKTEIKDNFNYYVINLENKKRLESIFYFYLQNFGAKNKVLYE